MDPLGPRKQRPLAAQFRTHRRAKNEPKGYEKPKQKILKNCALFAEKMDLEGVHFITRSGYKLCLFGSRFFEPERREFATQNGSFFDGKLRQKLNVICAKIIKNGVEILTKNGIGILAKTGSDIWAKMGVRTPPTRTRGNLCGFFCGFFLGCVFF